jgi:hypothetical protein
MIDKKMRHRQFSPPAHARTGPKSGVVASLPRHREWCRIRCQITSFGAGHVVVGGGEDENSQKHRIGLALFVWWAGPSKPSHECAPLTSLGAEVPYSMRSDPQAETSDQVSTPGRASSPDMSRDISSTPNTTAQGRLFRLRDPRFRDREPGRAGVISPRFERLCAVVLNEKTKLSGCTRSPDSDAGTAPLFVPLPPHRRHAHDRMKCRSGRIRRIAHG